MSDPQQIGPYRIVSRLGSGGMGWVYLARSPGGRTVAVKVVRPELAEREDFRQRFTREVTAARKVSGAYTAAVVDADPDGDPPWLATVYVPAPSLADAVQDSGPLPESQVRLLAAGLVEALQAIHQAQVVHRDMKPSNVLLADDGPRVIDFGISLVGGLDRLTLTGAVVGTPAYMSPEQMMGRPVREPTDVFSLGGVLAYAVTGRPPFGQDGGVFYRVTSEPPDLDGVPPGLREVLAQCLAKAPERRPGLRELLGEFLGRREPYAPRRVTAAWRPSPAIAEGIRARKEEAAVGRSDGAAMPVRSLLRQHAQTLLDAGLTDQLVVEVVSRARA